MAEEKSDTPAAGDPQKAVPVPELGALAHTIISGLREMKRDEIEAEIRIENGRGDLAKEAIRTLKWIALGALVVASIAILKGHGDVAIGLLSLLTGAFGGFGLGSFFGGRKKDEN